MVETDKLNQLYYMIIYDRKEKSICCKKQYCMHDTCSTIKELLGGNFCLTICNKCFIPGVDRMDEK